MPSPKNSDRPRVIAEPYRDPYDLLSDEELVDQILSGRVREHVVPNLLFKGRAILPRKRPGVPMDPIQPTSAVDVSQAVEPPPDDAIPEEWARYMALKEGAKKALIYPERSDPTRDPNALLPKPVFLDQTGEFVFRDKPTPRMTPVTPKTTFSPSGEYYIAPRGLLPALKGVQPQPPIVIPGTLTDEEEANLYYRMKDI
jgi:hypothetical protein